jgi:transcription elongation factor GreB
MTREGFDVIVAEIDRLWHVERPQVVQEVQDAADLGDRSENAAYIYGKKRLRQIDSRLEFLRRRIEDAEPIDLGKLPAGDRVRWGAVVDVEHEDGRTFTWRLVDKEESDPKLGRISVQSPVGRALLGKRVGDVIEAPAPSGTQEYELLAIRWGGGPP